jgi:RAD3-like DEAD/DEAH box helicase
MTPSQPTIAETVTEIRAALQDYIEATYHVGHPELVAQRRALLDEEGVLFRAPYIESTPRYTVSRRFAELDIPESARALLDALSHPPGGQAAILYDPPYTHQGCALEATTRDGMSLVVTTGTGSGKTETFLLPIIAKLAAEAEHGPESFATPAVRALLLYPMNALVNDQLGRLRLLCGNPLVTSQFTAWANRPARFARYTSRTLYPGVRTTKKDSIRLKSIERFYIALLDQAHDPSDAQHERARALVANLQERGKWPAKPDLRAWFGDKGSRWKNTAGDFVRAVLRPEDPELFTRHEVLTAPPDILVTNYSMLEYMLMRPLERPVFDATRDWLDTNPDERLLLVVDEAHLYRGAAGAEVGLLLRRLRARLGISAERLQVICTSASFKDPDYAREFAAQLSGKSPGDFLAIAGDLDLRPGESKGSEADASALASVALDQFYQADDDSGRLRAVSDFIAYRSADSADEGYEPALHRALESFPPMRLLVNLTMQQAMPLEELGRHVFATDDGALADRAVTALIALGSTARRSPGEPGLLPCRVHAFFRGLPGLWACVDPECPTRDDIHSGSPVGALYSQPRASCDCGARVFELYTCRNCGSAYARAYTDNIEDPRFLWHEQGGGFLAVSGHVPELLLIDLLLEEPTGPAEPADLDLSTGRLNPTVLGDRMRRVFLRRDRVEDGNDADDDDSSAAEAMGEFKPCGVCGTTAGYGRSPVQDHQTKGDQPFQALVTRQIEVQPQGA